MLGRIPQRGIADHARVKLHHGNHFGNDRWNVVCALIVTDGHPQKIRVGLHEQQPFPNNVRQVLLQQSRESPW
jgi:hypothetical protein